MKETGNRKQETGNRKQETGNRKQKNTGENPRKNPQIGRVVAPKAPRSEWGKKSKKNHNLKLPPPGAIIVPLLLPNPPGKIHRRRTTDLPPGKVPVFKLVSG
jgi:hypothetical protein